MAALNTPGLNRWQQMQKRPFGTNTNMSAPTPAQTDYKRQVQDYGQALRNLRRAGRRGSTSAALGAIGAANEARERGVQGVQGIRRAEDQNVAAQRYEATLGGMANDRETVGAQARLGAPSPGGSGEYTQNELNSLFLPDGAPPPAAPQGDFGASRQPGLKGRSLLEENRRQIAQRDFIGKVQSGLVDRGGILSDEERSALQANASRLGLDAEKFNRFVGTTSEAVPAPPKAIPVGEKPWALAEEARAAIPRYLGAVDKVNSAIEDIEQRGYESAMDRAERAGQLAARPKPLRTTVQSAEEQIAAANREVDQAVPEAKPYHPPSNAELAGRAVGGAIRTMERIGNRNLDTLKGGAERSLDTVRGGAERSLDTVRGGMERNARRANQAISSAWEALKRFREGVS